MTATASGGTAPTSGTVLGDMKPKSWRGAAALLVLGVVVAVGLCLLWWGGALWRALVPMARPGWDRLPAEVRVTAEAQFRLAVIQATAGAGAVVALVYTARNYRLTHRGQVTDRFTKALERLGSGQMYIRIGGILALEQIVQDAPDQADPAKQTLNAFLYDRAPRRQSDDPAEKTSQVEAVRRPLRRRMPPPPAAPPLPDRPEVDVQAALTALTRPVSRRRRGRRQSIDLSHLHLTRAKLSHADLTGADLEGADLTEARFAWADLTGARFALADLTGADLFYANLTRAGLVRVDLTKAHLDRANLFGANLFGANLDGADLYGANLDGVRDLGRDQLLRARSIGAVRNLPTSLADDPAVAARLAAEGRASARDARRRWSRHLVRRRGRDSATARRAGRSR